MKFPVLDSNDRDGMVLGFATTARGAQRVAATWAASNGLDGTVSVEMQGGVQVTAHPDINTAAEARAANAAGRGWIVSVTPHA